MPSYYWIKLWLDLIDDYRMASLPDHLWRRAIEFFLLARTAGGDGQLPPLSEVSWKLHTTPESLEADLAELQAATSSHDRPGIVQHTDEGWFVTNFAKRQRPLSSTERSRKHRERLQRNGNETVAGPSLEVEEEVDVDVEVDVEEEAQPPPRKRDSGGAGGEKIVSKLVALNVHSNTAKKLVASPPPERRETLVDDMSAWIAHYSKQSGVKDAVALAVPQVRAGIPPPAPEPEYQRFLAGGYAEVIER